LIIESGIRLLHVACRDNNPAVAKKSGQELSAAGVTVRYDFPHEISRKCFELNEDFYYNNEYRRPLLAVKAAVTLDGKIACAGGDSRWISGEESRKYVHVLRSRHDAVAAGSNTCVIDNSRFTVRLRGYRGQQPVRIIIDRDCILPENHPVFEKHAKLILVVPKDRHNYPSHYLRMQEKEIIVLEKFELESEQKKTEKSHFNLGSVFTALSGKYSLNSILIEGGAGIFSSLLNNNLINRYHFFIGPKITGDGLNALSPFQISNPPGKMSAAAVLCDVRTKKYGSDVYMTGYAENRGILLLQNELTGN